MKKVTLFILSILFCTTSLPAETPSVEAQKPPVCQPIRKAFNYFEVGLGPFPAPIPSFAVGHRDQWGHHGQDLSLYASTIVMLTQVKLNALYHYYFKPCIRSQFYIGGGVGISTLIANNSHIKNSLVCLSPEFVIGREFLNQTNDRRFFQMQVSFPTYEVGRLKTLGMHNHVLYYPIVIFSYGIGF